MAQAKTAARAEPKTSNKGRPFGLPLVHLKDMAPSKKVLWAGALGAMAIGGILDWPVAIVVAVGTHIAGQEAREAARAKNGKSST